MTFDNKIMSKLQYASQLVYDSVTLTNIPRLIQITWMEMYASIHTHRQCQSIKLKYTSVSVSELVSVSLNEP